MKRLIGFLFVILLGFVPIASAQETIQKMYCMSAIGYPSNIDDLKKELLSNAKREAVSELFGELIKSSTKIENFKLTEDKMMAASVGFVRVKGNPIYYHGENLGEVCVRIDAYAKDEDFEKFKPKLLVKKSCVAEGDIRTIKKRAEERAKLEALLDYNQVFKKYPSDQILPLLHEVSFSESGFISNTLVYCTKVEGIIYPIEIATLPELHSAASISEKTSVSEKQLNLETETSTKIPYSSPSNFHLFNDFKNIRVEIAFLQLIGSNNLVLNLQYTNNTKTKITIMLDERMRGSGNTYMKDDVGNKYPLEKSYGIGILTNMGNDDTHLTLLPGIPVSISLRFSGKRSWDIGKTFSLTSPQLILAQNENGHLERKSGKYVIESTFKIEIKDIKQGRN